MMEEKKVNKIRSKKLIRKYLPLILVVLVVIFGFSSAYFYKKSQMNPATVSQEEIDSLVEKVGKLAVIPKDETPTLATVSDPEALKNQAFFVDAKKGYKVLIYSNAKKAILYDPESNKIVNIAPLNTDASTTTNTTTASPVETVPSTKKK